MRVFLLVLGIALTLAASAAGAARRASDVLSLQGMFRVTAIPASCPAGAASSAVCYAVSGGATIRGLGRVTDKDTLITIGTVDGPGTACAQLSFSPDVITVAGKGTIDASISFAPGCEGIPTGFVVTGGSGDFTGASGSGTFVPGIVQAGSWVDNGRDDADPDQDDILNDWRTNAWAGSINAPNYTFDLIPPVLSGAISKTVTAPRGAKRLRVRFDVRAKDAVDGAVPVTCTHRSGSLFPIGRTNVRCSATDSSANTATKRFTITIRRRS